MKKIILTLSGAALLFLASCSNKIMSNSKNAATFPGMTVTRADYKLSKDITAEVEVKEWSTLGGYLRGAKSVGEKKKEIREGLVSGFNLDPASRLAVYKILDANPQFDYVTNIRVSKDYKRSWLLFFTKYNTKVKVTLKGITLNTEKF